MDIIKRHFIIVDDDRDVRYFIRRVILLQFPKAEISEAPNGEEALRLYEKSGADLMVIDHDLPRMEGTELVRQLRSRRVAIPLVMVSNFPAVRELALAAGATLFVDKKELNAGLTDLLPKLLPQTGA